MKLEIVLMIFFSVLSVLSAQCMEFTKPQAMTEEEKEAREQRLRGEGIKKIFEAFIKLINEATSIENLSSIKTDIDQSFIPLGQKKKLYAELAQKKQQLEESPEQTKKRLETVNLITFAMLNNLDKLKESVAKGADVNAIRYYQDNNAFETPLARAVFNKNRPIVEFLIQAGADLNIPVYLTQGTPLNFAITTKDFELAKYLIEHGARLDKINFDGLSALELAQIIKFNELVEYISSMYDELVDTISQGHVSKLEQLLKKYKYDLNADLGGGNTALYYAIRFLQPEIVEKLLEYGADPLAPVDVSKKHTNAIDWALELMKDYELPQEEEDREKLQDIFNRLSQAIYTPAAEEFELLSEQQKREKERREQEKQEIERRQLEHQIGVIEQLWPRLIKQLEEERAQKEKMEIEK